MKMSACSRTTEEQGGVQAFREGTWNTPQQHQVSVLLVVFSDCHVVSNTASRHYLPEYCDEFDLTLVVFCLHCVNTLLPSAGRTSAPRAGSLSALVGAGPAAHTRTRTVSAELFGLESVVNKYDKNPAV